MAQRFLARGVRVLATARNPAKLAHLGVETVDPARFPQTLPENLVILYSLPPAAQFDLSCLGDRPNRVVYLSSTGVYGDATEVNLQTEPDDSTAKARARITAEREIQKHFPSTLILRPAAIYGPGRGVQESIQTHGYHMGDNFISRIHVDDLAAHAEAALLSNLTGAYPVADEGPCTTREIGEFCARLLGIEVQEPQDAARRTSNRRVDGSAIRKLLGITLRYATYKEGIPASLC